MAGAQKKRAIRERAGRARVSNASSNPPDSQHESSSSPSSISARYDGDRDPSSNTGLRDPNASKVVVDLMRLGDIGAAAWAVAYDVVPERELPARPARPNVQGAPCEIMLNTWNVLDFGTKPVYQWDVLMGTGNDKRALVAKLWDSKAIQSRLGPGWVFDGNRIAWSLSKPRDDNGQFTNALVTKVNLDQEQGRRMTEANRDRNVHKASITLANEVRFEQLRAYLDNTADFNNSCLEAISFMDHLLNQTPSRNFTRVKRSFFPKNPQNKMALSQNIEAYPGVYSSMRIVRNPSNQASLSVNVDVANGTFFKAGKLTDVAVEFCREQNVVGLSQVFAAQKGKWERSGMRREFKRLRGLEVEVKHRGKGKIDEFKIDKVLPLGPRDHKFERASKDDQGQVIKREWVTVAQHFAEKYGITLNSNIPLVQMTKKRVVMPMETCFLKANQRYAFKLDERQTSQMIRFAVTLPKQRWAAILNGVNMLNWDQDKFLKNYGVRISNTPSTVKGRILPAPDVTFTNKKIAGKQAGQGRWRIDGMQFLARNTTPLRAWGVCVIQARGACDKPTVEKFFHSFIKIYSGHGGVFAGRDTAGRMPVIIPGNLQKGGEMITEIWNSTGMKYGARPQILFFIVPDRNSETYNRIKKSCECRYGVVSQVMQSAHVKKCQPQYISNVCMKVNAKLGGATSRAAGILPKLNPAFQQTKTLIIGADVSHSAPGSQGASMAAMTMSSDPTLTRYVAACNTNGFRVEIITTANIKGLLEGHIRSWMANVGGGRTPERLLYFRDGISEGQYQHVINQELRDLRELINQLSPVNNTKITAVVCSKRHHVRFFPKTGGDRNGNPQPGTLIESGVTHPREFDFYLNSHSAIKGTARPVHYHVLLNECKISNEELQQLIYEHCYQYTRATTPVSLFPAVYYAHLASNRARAHENKPAVSSGKKDTTDGKKSSHGGSSTDKPPTEVPPLMPLNPTGGLHQVMWYI